MVTSASAGPPARSPVTLKFETQYLKMLDDGIRQYKTMADRARAFFVALRLALVVSSASLPALITSAPQSSSGIAVLVAVLAGLDTQFRWGDEWQHFRSTQLALDRLVRAYSCRKAGRGQNDCVIPEVPNAEDFEWLFTEAESLLQSEAERFWRFRITKWQAGERTA